MISLYTLHAYELCLLIELAMYEGGKITLIKSCIWVNDQVPTGQATAHILQISADRALLYQVLVNAANGPSADRELYSRHMSVNSHSTRRKAICATGWNYSNYVTHEIKWKLLSLMLILHKPQILTTCYISSLTFQRVSTSVVVCFFQNLKSMYDQSKSRVPRRRSVKLLNAHLLSKLRAEKSTKV